MATRSSINLFNKETGKIIGCYCHFDGYISHVGRLLKQNYTSDDQIKYLIYKGPIETLNTTIESSIFFIDGVQHHEVTTTIEIPSYNYDYLFINGEWLVRHSGTNERFISYTYETKED